MREPWVYRRLMAMLAGTVLIGGIIGWLTYVEEDEPHESRAIFGEGHVF